MILNYMADLIMLATKGTVKDLMMQKNYNGSDVQIKLAMDQAAARSMAIYALASKSYPAKIGEDKMLDSLVNQLAAYIACKNMADTIDGKHSFQADINDIISAIKLHIGLVDSKQDGSFGTVATTGPRMIGLGDFGDD